MLAGWILGPEVARLHTHPAKARGQLKVERAQQMTQRAQHIKGLARAIIECELLPAELMPQLAVLSMLEGLLYTQAAKNLLQSYVECGCSRFGTSSKGKGLWLDTGIPICMGCVPYRLERHTLIAFLIYMSEVRWSVTSYLLVLTGSMRVWFLSRTE